ncbi:hypothetical protein IMF27_09460 [Pseudomonas sp. PCH199]|uniref:hypothetical protein n=1 Tax=unclassified Pseudomonas TaxID=196821 RepID=UPI000BD39B70|nr:MULTISPECIES: hypothetical protein [unclassified Pseudomonas]MCW8275894.1 hypothetical protein [Pseudomonas sp. PCH199]PAM83966.1 hypothetical protein CES87_09695 [Pseudomonas sp. ERMR1:02]
MNGPLHPSYTNEVSPEFFRSLNNSPFTEAQLAQFDEEARAIIDQQRAYLEAHPPRAIYRFATEGSQTRDGGVIHHATSRLEFTLDCGRKVRAAQQGDVAIYADGRTAQIVTTAGEGNSYLALVGSRLSNGDEIINTPQDIGLFVVHEGDSMSDDFLPSTEGEKIP